MTDDNFVTDVVDKLKKQGLFDRFRKECLADVDTKPAYQNLQLRVKEAVGKYLHGLKWKPDLNKNQLRENLRRHLNDLPMLTNGIDRVVDQVVKPKIMKSLKPQIDKVVCEHMDLDYEQWLSDLNDAQSKKQTKSEDAAMTCSLPSQCPSFPPIMTMSAPMGSAMMNMSTTILNPSTSILNPSVSVPPPVVHDLQLPPPPPPISEEANDSMLSPPEPPPPPPLPSDASEDETSVPAPPPDSDVFRYQSPPPLPPDEDEDNNPALPPTPVEESLAEDEVFESTRILTRSPDLDRPSLGERLEEFMVTELAAREASIMNISRKVDSVSRTSVNDSFSNDNSFPFPIVEPSNIDGVSKEYRFAWNNFHESDLSNVSVSSVHTSDLSNFVDDEENDGLDFSHNYDPEMGAGRNFSNDIDSTKDSDHKMNFSLRHSLNDSIHESLDTSNASLTSSGRRKTKKEELKERKMEEKKELKRRRVLNRKYCSEEFMSIFSDKNDMMDDTNNAVVKDKTKVTLLNEDESKGNEEEDDYKLTKDETITTDVDNTYSPYSNISEASSDSVVVVGVEPAKTKKGKKSKSRRRSRSSDGNRRKKKRRRHRSSRRSSRHSGGDDVIDEASFQNKQEGIRTKSILHDFESSSKSYPEEEMIVEDHYDDDVATCEALKKKLKKSLDRINFGEAERQAAALRMTGSAKQPPFPVMSPTWQKPNFNSPARSSRPSLPHEFAGQSDFIPIADTSTTLHKHTRHDPGNPYHPQAPSHFLHEPFNRAKYTSEATSYRIPKTTHKRVLHVEEDGDEMNVDVNETKRHKRPRKDDTLRHSKHSSKNTKLNSEEQYQQDERSQRRQYETSEKRNKR